MSIAVGLAPVRQATTGGASAVGEAVVGVAVGGAVGEAEAAAAGLGDVLATG